MTVCAIFPALCFSTRQIVLSHSLLVRLRFWDGFFSIVINIFDSGAVVSTVLALCPSGACGASE